MNTYASTYKIYCSALPIKKYGTVELEDVMNFLLHNRSELGTVFKKGFHLLTVTNINIVFIICLFDLMSSTSTRLHLQFDLLYHKRERLASLQHVIVLMSLSLGNWNKIHNIAGDEHHE